MTHEEIFQKCRENDVEITDNLKMELRIHGTIDGMDPADWFDAMFSD